MTRISLLEGQRLQLVAQKDELELHRDGIYAREKQAMSDALLTFFTGFSPYAYIEVSRGSVYFKADHPDYKYKKDLFTLYFTEEWNDDSKAFKGVDLSYYTTSTKGLDAWELRRLRMLGDLAEIVLTEHDKIVDIANKAVAPFKQEYADVYQHMHIVSKAIRDVEKCIDAIRKDEISAKLMKEGVEFDKGVYIRLKFNFEPFVKDIKLIDISRSGKKATAVFTYVHGGHTSREENVSVESITNQVLGYAKNIVEKELLTSQ